MSEKDNAGALNTLLAMGFEASQARVALARHDGNLEEAANELLLTTIPEDHCFLPRRGTASAVVSDVVQIQGTSSQYSYDDGRSACTCIALQGAVQFLAAMDRQDTAIDAAFLDQMVQEGCRIYREWNKQQTLSSPMEHTSVEDVVHLFPSLVMDGIRQGLLSPGDGWSSILQECQSPTDWVCCIMIKPPETVLLCLPPIGGPQQEFYLFDSHPRRSEFGTAHASARRHASLPDLVGYSVQPIFPPVMDLGPDVPEYMTAMYNSFDLYPLRKVPP
jgi:UBA/TS-N domain